MAVAISASEARSPLFPLIQQVNDDHVPGRPGTVGRFARSASMHHDTPIASQVGLPEPRRAVCHHMLGRFAASCMSGLPTLCPGGEDTVDGRAYLVAGDIMRDAGHQQ